VAPISRVLPVLAAYAAASIADVAITYHFVAVSGGFSELNPIVAEYMLGNPLMWLTADLAGFSALVILLPLALRRLGLRLFRRGEAPRAARLLTDPGRLAALLGALGVAIKLSAIIHNLLIVL
jgi:hypothetical protein